MAKFLIISAVFPPEPVVSAKLSFDLALEIAKKKNVVVISPKPTRPYGFKFETIVKNANFEHYQLESYTCPESKMIGRLKETYSFGKACYQFIAENHNSIDQIYSNTWPLFAQYYAVKAARKFNIPICIHVQDIYPESLSNKLPVIGGIIYALLKPIDNFVFANAKNIIAISDKMKHYLGATRKNSIEKISVVSNWQDEEDFIKYNEIDKPIKSGIFTFMYLGNIGPVAGIELLIEAFGAAELKNCRLVIAGSGAMKDTLAKQAKSYPNSIIEFWPVPDGKVQEVQGQADVMLLPMKKGAASSSIPSKLPAYMFSKKPVIACVDSDSDTADAIKNSDCGWILEPENTEALVSCIKDLVVTDREQMEEKGSNGYRYAIENFSKKHNLKKLMEIINIKN